MSLVCRVRRVSRQQQVRKENQSGGTAYEVREERVLYATMDPLRA